MCKFVVKHWMHEDATLHMRGMLVDVCATNIATPGAVPDDCADRVVEYLDNPEPGSCPMCLRNRAFQQHVQQGMPGGHPISSGRLHPMREAQAHSSSSEGTQLIVPVDIDGDSLPLLPQHTGHTSGSSRTFTDSASRGSVSTDRQTSISICFPGRHDMEDIGDGALRCRLCGVVSGQRASVFSDSVIYDTPRAFPDDDDGASTVASVHDGRLSIDDYQQTWSGISQRSTTPAASYGAPLRASPPPDSPAESIISTATSALWREHDKAVRERDLSRNF